MPLTPQRLDDRTYADLLSEALRRIPVHNPEWTNFNDADPGVTLIQLFAFLTESLLYRANQVPERNRRTFLSLLGLRLQPGASARGLVAFSNERGPQRSITLNQGVELRSGQIPFRTTRTIDVLPVDAQVYYKRERSDAEEGLKDYYRQLYRSYHGQAPKAADIQLYQTLPLNPRRLVDSGVDFAEQSIDHSLWVALLLRDVDRPLSGGPGALSEARAAARRIIKGTTLSLGVVPWLAEQDQANAVQRLTPGGQANAGAPTPLQCLLPNVVADQAPGGSDGTRKATYRPVDARLDFDVLASPGVIQIPLPDDASQLDTWTDLDPLEAGVGDFPPSLEDTAVEERVITWIRIHAASGIRLQLLWVGINAAPVDQQTQVVGERLPDGTGQPEQVVRLANRPVLPGSVRVTVATETGTDEWRAVDDLLSAGAEVPVPEPRRAPGSRPVRVQPSQVFALDAEAGEIRFGDGTHGARPPAGAVLRASYAYGVGLHGNVGENTITSGPALPAGVKVTNPVRTWGGADAESIAQGERRIGRYLQHRDRLVSAQDFLAITRRTPGVDIGRVEVLPAYNPLLARGEPGDSPGVVTIMVIPRADPRQPDAPVPDKLFLSSVCTYLEPRRLVTTELFVRGPAYTPIWVSVGIDVFAGVSVPQVREDVKQVLRAFLSPLPDPNLSAEAFDEDAPLVVSPATAPVTGRGWPLRKPVLARELMAVASRVPGVQLVNAVLLAEGNGNAKDSVDMQGLALPRISGLSVIAGQALSLVALRGQAQTPPDSGAQGPRFVPVPIVPEECR